MKPDLPNLQTGPGSQAGETFARPAGDIDSVLTGILGEKILGHPDCDDGHCVQTEGELRLLLQLLLLLLLLL